MEQFKSAAILVDGDNITSQFAGQILRKTEKLGLGQNRIRWSFCNTHSVNNWEAAESFRIIHAGTEKNATDILLSLRAMELALKDGVEAFVIVSSDRDLSHIATALRELGRHVTGMGKATAPSAFRRACEAFVELAEPSASAQKLDDLNQIVHDVLSEHPNGILLNRLNAAVRNRDPNFRISKTQSKSWPRHLAMNERYFRISGSGAEQRVHRVIAE